MANPFIPTPIEEYVTNILQYVPGAPTILLHQHIHTTIIHFCERTLCMHGHPDPFQLVADQNVYALQYTASPDTYRIIDIDSLWIGDKSNPLIKTTEQELDSYSPGWRGHTAPEPSRYYLLDVTNWVSFYPIPTQASTENVEMNCTVTFQRAQMTAYDAHLYENYLPVIQAGALASLLRINGASWENQQLADRFALDYRRGVAAVRKETLTGVGEYPGRAIPQSYTIQGTGGVDSYRRGFTWG